MGETPHSVLAKEVDAIGPFRTNILVEAATSRQWYLSEVQNTLATKPLSSASGPCLPNV